MPSSGIKLDLHNHTHYSSDGGQSPAELLTAAKARGLHCIAITDHNTVKGGLEGLALADSDPRLPSVIPGVELLTDSGEIIGLYVSEEIPARLPAAEAVARIRAQGGLVYLPHPYDRVRRGAVAASERERVARLADIVEVVNGRALCSRGGNRARRLAEHVGRLTGAGSDAHRRGEVGTAYVVVDAVPTRETLLDLVAGGHVEHGLRLLDYFLNWGRMGRAPLTRWRRRLLARGS